MNNVISNFTSYECNEGMKIHSINWFINLSRFKIMITFHFLKNERFIYQDCDTFENRVRVVKMFVFNAILYLDNDVEVESR